jgi:hypothetical protein
MDKFNICNQFPSLTNKLTLHLQLIKKAENKQVKLAYFWLVYFRKLMLPLVEECLFSFQFFNEANFQSI